MNREREGRGGVGIRYGGGCSMVQNITRRERKGEEGRETMGVVVADGEPRRKELWQPAK